MLSSPAEARVFPSGENVTEKDRTLVPSVLADVTCQLAALPTAESCCLRPPRPGCLAVRRKHDRIDRALVPPVLAKLLASGDVPQTDRFPTRRGQGPAVRRKGHREKTGERTALWGSVNWRMSLPLETSHSRTTDLSSPAEARVLPSGENATAKTASWCPEY